MKNKNVQAISPEFLSERIEQIIQEHMDACRRVAEEAITRAFQQSIDPRRVVFSQPAPKSLAATPSSRRTRDELHGLRDRLYEVICSNPGETMLKLAPQLGLPATALNRPMALLKAQGKVRSVGERSFTRYFPTGEEGKVEN